MGIIINLRVTFALAAVFSLVACGGSGSGQSDADELSANVLTGSETPSLVHLTAFQPPADSVGAAIPFSGTVAFSASPLISRVPDTTGAGNGLRIFPAFSVAMVSDGDTLIPVERGVINTWRQSDSYWDVVLGAGRVWAQTGDGDWQRASFPVTLISRKFGQAKNCVGLFLYNQTHISNTFVQCSQETSPVDVHLIDNMRTLVATTYTPQIFLDHAQIIAAYSQEKSRRLPVRDWSELDRDGEIKKAFNRAMPLDSAVSLGAVVVDGTIYLQPPTTRHGDYPYPTEMRHGVYSVTKSMAGALALLYFSQRYGDQLFDAHVTDYVPALAPVRGWEGVTFGHVINMVTGTGGDDYAGNGALIVPFIRAGSAEKSIQAIADLGDAPPLPGTTYHYVSTNTFVLSYALQRYVEQQEGSGVDYWDMVQANVLDPIGVYKLPMARTMEPDGSKGIPLLNGASYPTADDAAKIALLFHNDGAYAGTQLLSRNKTREALHRTAWNGYDAGPGTRYLHSFRSTEVSGNRCSANAPYMLGHGGNYVVVLENGLILLRFSDAEKYDLHNLLLGAGMIRPFC